MKIALGKFGALAAIGAALAGCATSRPHAGSLIAGHDLAQQKCSGCHAIELDGPSPNPQAPRFRELYQRYPVQGLRPAFTRGLQVAHPMPRFRLAEGDIDHLLEYLESLNPCAKASSDTGSMKKCFAPL